MGAFESDLGQIVAELNQVSQTQGISSTDGSRLSGDLDRLLAQAVTRGASDLLLIADTPVAMRIQGKLVAINAPKLDGEDTRSLLLPLLSNRQVQELQRQCSIDFCFSREGLGRFRINIHFQRGTWAASIRLLPSKVPSLESLNLLPALRKLAEARQGLVLLTGCTGSGKSSTLAALIDIINIERQAHIVTIEDPVEFVHSNRNSIVEQIEVGQDTPDFARSVRSLMRQTPDVILVGEMRDAETIATVLTAAETGHLVFSTLHTNDTSQAVSRILDSFPLANQQQIRQQFSLAMLAIVAQQLIPSANGKGRYPALEIMLGTHPVRNLIRKGEDHQLYTALATGRAEGMISMEQSLAEMVKQGRITRESALAHCFRPEDMRRYL